MNHCKYILLNFLHFSEVRCEAKPWMKPLHAAAAWSLRRRNMPDTAVAPPPIAGGRPAGAGGGRPVNLPLLRDPDHYEEINVIGNGECLNYWLNQSISWLKNMGRIMTNTRTNKMARVATGRLGKIVCFPQSTSAQPLQEIVKVLSVIRAYSHLKWQLNAGKGEAATNWKC